MRSEQHKNSQFQDTTDQLKIYASSHFVRDIKYLKILFDNLERPAIPKPKPPGTEVIKTEDDDEGFDVIKPTPDKFAETLYNEEIKQWFKDKRSLDATITAIYNII